MNKLELTLRKGNLTGENIGIEMHILRVQDYPTPKQIVEKSNKLMKEEIATFRTIRPGALVAIPKVEKTSEDSSCFCCDYKGEMTSFKITGYENFERERNGKKIIDSRYYTTEVVMASCPRCGTIYQGKDIERLTSK
jgi:hypothetical protein